VLYDDDCDDADETSTVVSEDGDCDGSLTTEDCDDDDSSIYPGAPDDWYDGIDSNCDGADDWDQDGDGYRSGDHGGSDCDDEDETSTVTTEDADCDGVLTADDCDDDDPDSTVVAEDADCDGTVDDDTGEFVPSEGQWLWDDEPVITSSDCADAIELVESDLDYGEGFKVTEASSTGFTAVFEGVSLEADCTLDGLDYECTVEGEMEDLMGYDINLIWTGDGEGSFADEETIEGSFDMDIDCEGSSCWLAEWMGDCEFPCDAQLDFSATHE